VFLEDDLSGRSLFNHPEGSRDKNHCNGHSARRAATIKKQALITKGAPTISPIKGSVIKQNTPSNAPSTRRMLPTLKLESLSERQDLALMSFLLFRPCSEWTARQRRQRYSLYRENPGRDAFSKRPSRTLGHKIFLPAFKHRLEAHCLPPQPNSKV
jgi:hypothetical protein